jgi:tetratricopeptide (TPR) repeat protein
VLRLHAQHQIRLQVDARQQQRPQEFVLVGECALATLAHLEGRFDEAERRYVEATDAMIGHGSLHAADYLRLAQTTIRVSRGTIGEHVEETEDLADLLAVALAAAGRLDEARLARKRAVPIRPDFFFTVLAMFRAMPVAALGELALLLGDPEEAGRHFEQAAVIAGRWTKP